ncbi:Bug family tripartite tricarboxylate transporter substrate binding protein [Hydrogenophaga sp.]|uniref:Bug family tripartite tricarboxylate transporter substrate binding protein n=1 Tax=Hydrogenophaga sp. TaxID=1904254 RepID=UPI003F6E75CA
MIATRRTFLGCAAALTSAAPLSVFAQSDFPNRPVRWVVGYPPGGGTDALARNVGQQLSSQLGQPVVVDNRPGAAGIIGAQTAAKSPPDGYTVLTADNGILVYNAALYKNLPYDPLKDFTSIGLMAKIQLLLIASPQSGYTSAKQLLDFAKANPGKLSYATPGAGSPHHLAMELFKAATGLHMVHIPYRGGAPALNDVMGGQVPLMLLDLPSGAGAVQQRKVIPLISFSDKRTAQLPDVPTMAELGFKDAEAYAWQGIVAPRDVPKDVRAKLNVELQKALANDGVRKRMFDAGQEPIPGTPEQMDALVASETKKWHALIKERDIRIEN